MGKEVGAAGRFDIFLDSGHMCPIFQVLLSKKHSVKSRIQALEF